jgi:hypothetical protein
VTVYGKTRLKSPGKIRRKRGKVKRKEVFFSKDAPLVHFIQKYIQKCLKIALMPLKLIVPYSNIIPLFKLQNYLKITFFPSFPRRTFQDVITRKIFKILWCPLHRIVCMWYRLIKHIDIWKKWLGFPIDGHMCSIKMKKTKDWNVVLWLWDESILNNEHLLVSTQQFRCQHHLTATAMKQDIVF